MKSARWLLFVLPAVLALLYLCARQADRSGELEVLRSTVMEFHRAINAADADAAVAMFTEDVIMMSNGWQTVAGKEAVAEIWRGSIESGFRTRDQEIISLELDGDLAYEATTQQWTMHREDQEDQWRSSKYVHIWKRQPDGSWKLHLDIWNNNPQPQ